MSGKRKAECACCGKVGWYKARGWIRPCYGRWLHAGKPAEGPPAPGYLINREEYVRVRESTSSIKGAANRIGISARQAQRYEKALKEGALV